MLFERGGNLTCVLLDTPVDVDYAHDAEHRRSVSVVLQLFAAEVQQYLGSLGRRGAPPFLPLSPST